MKDVIVAGRVPEGVTEKDLFGGVSHKPLLDLPHDYDMKTALAPHIERADGFVVLPGSDPLLTTSLLIGYQFQNPEVRGKPMVIYSPDDKPSPYVELIQTLRERGFVHQPEEQFYTVAKTIAEIPEKLNNGFGVPSGPKVEGHEDDPVYKDLVDRINREGASKTRPERNVAVFCSASNKDPHYLNMARETGQMLADNGYGMVFGGSNVSMMGEVAAGVHDRGGYVTGVTIPLFFGKEVQADQDKIDIDNIRIVSDIYERMHTMIDESDALVVLPGGIGTAQEMLAVMHMRDQDPELAAKPVVLYSEGGFWHGLQQMMEDYGYKEGVHFNVVDNQKDLNKVLDDGIPPANDAKPAGDTPPTVQRLASGPDIAPRRKHNLSAHSRQPKNSEADRRTSARPVEAPRQRRAP